MSAGQLRRPGEAEAPFAAQRQLTDFAEFAELFARWRGRFEQMSRGRFEGTLRVVAGGAVRLFEAETNQSLLTRGMDQTSMATFIPITPANERTAWSGRRLATGQLLAKTPEAPYGNLTGRGTVIRALLVPVEVLEDARRVLGGRDDGPRLAPWEARRPDPGAMAAWQRSMDVLLASALAGPSLLDGAMWQQLEVECLRRLVAVLESTRGGRAPHGSSRPRARLLRHAFDYLEAHARKLPTALDLCAELGVSDRTLRRAFLETVGMGPIAYLRVLRLHGARGDLLRARHGEPVKVADVARRWGFHRMGPFAGEYRRQFGELPSHASGVRGPQRPSRPPR